MPKPSFHIEISVHNARPEIEITDNAIWISASDTEKSSEIEREVTLFLAPDPALLEKLAADLAVAANQLRNKLKLQKQGV